MSSRHDDISVLLARCSDVHDRIKAAYAASLKNKQVSSELRLDVKYVCESYRSVLDYLAHDIREAHCPLANPSDRFYFPILPNNATFTSRTNQWYPYLDTACRDLWDYLESIQPYQRGFAWLGEFNRVNNENKHDRLVGQERSESPGGARITTPGVGSISWAPGVTFSGGISLMGAPIDPTTQLPIPNPGQRVERIIWVDFQFETTNISVQRLLSDARRGIEDICTKVQQWL